MFLTKRTLPRRTVLRGLGAAVALPLLDAMVPPLTALARTPATPARRLGFVYIPNGVAMNAEVNHWKPAGEGTDFELSSILTPLAPFRDHLTIVSGLSQPSAAEGANDGAHSRAAAGWLSGIGARQAQGANIQGGTTVDQVAADVLGRDTRLPSLELAIDSFSSSQVGNCDNGYDCVYLNTLAWRTPTTPLPMERHPAVVFERLFGEGGTAAQRQAEVRTDRSILDVVTGDIAALQRTVGGSDRARVDEYLDSVREIERRLQVSERAAEQELPPFERPTRIPLDFAEHTKLMFDLQWLAYQADVTRVTTFMLGRELGGRAYPELGVPVNHHGLSHHQDDPEKIADLAKINTYHVDLFAYFLEKIRSTPEGDGSLLDHVVLLYGGGLGDPNQHSHLNLPLALVGSTPQKRGRHLQYADTPLSNLLLAMLDKVGVPADRHGDSTGRLELEPLTGV
ncbi:MAG: DUF1552 domain-containing protein [Acidobacteria bacterium]|nr:DUF1552 domain-containing protein [Acidobacteriota bacterium]